MAEPQELTIATPTLRIAARVHGPDDAPVVVALHGWLDNAGSFDLLAPRLEGLRIIALDLPGHGESEHLPPGATYLFLDLVALVHAATVALGLERFMLLGHSLGAAISSTLAGTFPDRIERVALIEGLGPVTEPMRDLPERFAKALTAEADKKGKAPSVHETIDAAVDRLVQATALPRQAARIIAPRGLRAVEGGVTWRADPRLRLPSRMRLAEDAVLAFLRRIACPVLVVRGSKGSPFAPRAASERLAALGDARLVEAPGGHHVHLEAPAECAAVIGPFLRGA